MVRVIKAELADPQEALEQGDPIWETVKEELAEAVTPQNRPERITCSGCGVRIVWSLLCYHCGEDLTPRSDPEPLRKGKRLA